MTLTLTPQSVLEHPHPTPKVSPIPWERSLDTMGRARSSVVAKGCKLRPAIDGSAGLQILGNPPALFSNSQPEFRFSLSWRPSPASCPSPALLSAGVSLLRGEHPEQGPRLKVNKTPWSVLALHGGTIRLEDSDASWGGRAGSAILSQQPCDGALQNGGRGGRDTEGTPEPKAGQRPSPQLPSAQLASAGLS